MGKVKVKRSSLLLCVVGVMIVGAVVGRSYPAAGLIILLAAIGVYLLADVKGVVKTAGSFRTATKRQKQRLLLWCAMLSMAVVMIFGRGIPYFLMLALFAIDYIIFGAGPDSTRNNE